MHNNFKLTAETLESTLAKRNQRVQELEEMYQTHVSQTQRPQNIIVIRLFTLLPYFTKIKRICKKSFARNENTVAVKELQN